jgi:hypothetical protein
MAVAGKTSVAKLALGATAMSAEPCTSLAANQYQITNTAKRILNPDSAITVYDNGVAQADADVTINYLFGIITKVSGNFTGPVTIDGNYSSSHAWLEVRGYSLDASADLIDATVMASTTANRDRILGQKEATITINVLDTLLTALDSPGVSAIPWQNWRDGDRRVFELTFPSGQIFRAFVRLESWSESVAFDGQLETTVVMKTVAPRGTDQTEGSSLGFSS